MPPTSTKAAAPTKGFAPSALIIAAVALVGLILLPRLSFSRDEAKNLPAPAFVLPVIHNGEPGSRLSLADLKGQAVIVDFWATWCQPCAMQTPVLDRLSRRHRERGLRVVGVDVLDDDAAAAAGYAAQKGLSYPIVVDETGITQREYGVSKLPSLIIIDREGRIVHRTSGFVDEASLERLLKDVL
jgi:cytochrome c biogenesis protein CcmG, thiol:disulfide interchange protein DsbE